jgi:hypothetical protein
MKCIECRSTIASGIQAQRMICAYLQDDETTKLFGHQMPDGPIAAATGRLLHGWHNHCFHAQRKRQARGEVRPMLEVMAEEHDPEVLAAEMAARAELRRITDRRRFDPGYNEPVVADWREQNEAEIA